MKKTFYLLLFWFFSQINFAQGGGFNYKALISDNGNVLSNQVISIKFTVLENGTTAVYQETQTGHTDANGIIAFNIGEGSVVSGDFTTIDWGSNPYFLKVEIDTGSGYQDFGTHELKSVPYAKFAEKAGNVFSGDFNDLTNVPSGLSDGDDDTHLTDTQIAAMGYIKNPNDADHDATNELQTISKTGNTVTLSNSGGSFTDADTHLTDAQIGAMGYIKNPNDADSDDTNELQNLTLSGTDLSISNGNTVHFNNWDTNANDDVHSINDLSDARATDYGVFIGNGSGTNAYVQGDLVAVGRNVMPNASSADYSVGIGNSALNSLTSGYYNVALGYGAGHNLTTGESNVFIGYRAGYHETGSNKLYIANSETVTPLIYGDFSANELTINGSLSIKDGSQGTGKVLVSDANGKGLWSNNLPKQNRILILGSLNATVGYGNLYQSLTTSPSYGAYLTNTSTNNGIMIPINLPLYAQVTGATVYYRDDTSNNYIIQIIKKEIYTNNGSAIGSYTTSGALTSITYHHFSLNETINSNYQYYLWMGPASNSHWTGSSNSTLKAVKIYYKE